MRLRLTGAHPDTVHQRLRDQADASFDDVVPSGTVTTALVRRIPWLVNQRSRPSCVGWAFAAGINSVIASKLDVPTKNTGTAPTGIQWCSGIGIWRDAHRRQNILKETHRGTRLQYACDSLERRGWDPYWPGEELNEDEASGHDSIFEEMQAHDKRSAVDSRRRIWRTGSDRIDQIAAALTDKSLVVVGAWYLRDSFFRVRGDESTDADQPLPESIFGGGDNSHAMSVQGIRVIDGRRQLLIQNPWGTGWGGCFLPNGQWVRGCAWVVEAAVAESACCHDMMVMRVRP